MDLGTCFAFAKGADSGVIALGLASVPDGQSRPGGFSDDLILHLYAGLDGQYCRRKLVQQVQAGLQLLGGLTGPGGCAVAELVQQILCAAAADGNAEQNGCGALIPWVRGDGSQWCQLP